MSWYLNIGLSEQTAFEPSFEKRLSKTVRNYKGELAGTGIGSTARDFGFVFSSERDAIAFEKWVKRQGWKTEYASIDPMDD